MSGTVPPASTERVGGGLSARLIAVAVAGVLVAVAWIGAAGRPAAPSVATQGPVANPGPVAEAPRVEAATPAPSLGGDMARIPHATDRPRNHEAGDTPDPNMLPEPVDGFVVTGLAGGFPFRTPLREVQPGVLTGQFWLPDRPLDDGLNCELAQLWSTVARRQTTPLGSWDLSLLELASNHRAGRETATAEVGAKPRKLWAPRPIRTGYTFQVTVRLTYADVKVVDFLLRLGVDR